LREDGLFWAAVKVAHQRKVAMPKRKPRVTNPTSCPLDVMDEAANCCLAILAVGELLANCELEALEPNTIPVAGALIADQAEKLTQNLKILRQREETPPPSS
jgi:hypothetical protein